MFSYKRKLLYNILFFCICLLVNYNFAQTSYYISSVNGNDNNSGKSPNNAWKTITKVNDASFLPGDKILFERGSTWFETLIPSSSGTSENPLTYAAYGTGERPIISSGDEIFNWVLQYDNIYRASFSKTPKSIFFELSDTVYWGNQQKLLANLQSERDYYLDTNSNLIYVYSAEKDPTEVYKKIIGAVRDWCIISTFNVDSHNSIFKDFELKYAREGGIRILDDNYVTIENIKSHHHGADDDGGHGVLLKGQNCKILNNYFYENGEHGIFLNFYPNTTKFIKNVLIEGNFVWDNYHTGIDIMNDQGLPEGISNLVIKNNTVWDSPDRKERENDISIQLLSWGEGTIDSVLICYNKTYNSNGISFNIHKRSNYINIYNNLSYMARSYGFNIDTKGVVNVKNNICVASDSWYAVAMDSTDNINMDYNIWFGGKLGVILRKHLAYNAQNDFYESTKLGEHSYFQKPSFVNENKFDFRLEKNSIGVDSGTDLGLKEDFNYSPIVGEPDIGIFENQEINNTIKLVCKVGLEGAYYRDSTYKNIMQTELTNKNLLPYKQPYNLTNINYYKEESIKSYPNSTIVDWIIVELRNPVNNLLTSKVALLNNNGIITDLNGYSPLMFNLVNENSFYIIIRHRNHLDIMNKNKVEVKPNYTIFYDFTKESSAYYGDSLASKKVNDKWLMIAGDINQDNKIDSDDIKMLSKTKNNVYSPLDVNLDGNINYDDLFLTSKYNQGYISYVPKLEHWKEIENEKFMFANYPNPFNSKTKIIFFLPEDNNYVKLNVFNSIGELVKILIDKELLKGFYNLNFNADNLSSGMYIATLQVNNKLYTKKIMLVK